MSNVVLDGVTYRYGSVVAADRVSLTVEPGEFFALLGPSGSGKTTILRLIAGFNTPQEGKIFLSGENVRHTPVYRRQIGFVFQNFALFPHMTVEQNVAFGLESQHIPKHLSKDRVYQALQTVQLIGMEKRRPSQLSGGQQQRVAFARAIVTEPHVLLLDEPLASLDRKLRTEMQVELRELQRRLGITTIFVTHDQEEAMTLADRIAVMQAGRIEQIGPPLSVYGRPRTRFVSEFLGLSNIFTGVISDLTQEYAVVHLSTGETIKAEPNPKFGIGDAVEVMVRPEQMHIGTGAAASVNMNTLKAFIGHISFAGVSLTYHLYGENGLSLKVFEQSSLQPTPPTIGAQVIVSWLSTQTFILDESVNQNGRA